MTKKFHSLIRYHRWHVDEARRALGQLLGEVTALENQAEQLERDIVTEQTVASDNPIESGYTYGAFAHHSIVRREKLAQAIAEVENKVAVAQETTREAYLNLKSFELAQEGRDEVEGFERMREEQSALDELGLERFRRREN